MFGFGIASFLRSFIVPCFFLGGMVIVFVSLRKPHLGLYLMAFLIPQPNIWHRFYEYPLGHDFLDFLFIAILLGIIFNKDRSIILKQNSKLILILILFSYIGLLISSSNFYSASAFDISNPIFQEWKNYVMMIFLYILTISVCRDQNSRKIMTLILCLTVLIVSLRSFRNFTPATLFSYDHRASGPFWAVCLDANHFAAFIVDYVAVFAGLYLFDNNKRRKWLYIAAVAFGSYPILFAYSRGAYLSALAVIIVLGLLKKRSLLIFAVLLVVGWNAFLPQTVVDRISMTKNESGELDTSTSTRLKLWDSARGVFEQNPVFGVGYEGFKLSGKGGGYWDTHNYFLKILCEGGVIGLAIFLLCLFKALLSGWKLFINGKIPFQKGLGLGFLVCVLSIIITNLFGNRFSFFVLGSYFFIFWALVDSSLMSLDEQNEDRAGNEVQFKSSVLAKFLA